MIQARPVLSLQASQSLSNRGSDSSMGRRNLQRKPPPSALGGSNPGSPPVSPGGQPRGDQYATKALPIQPTPASHSFQAMPTASMAPGPAMSVQPVNPAPGATNRGYW